MDDSMLIIDCHAHTRFSLRFSLLRNRPDLQFAHRIHEQIMPAINRAGGQIVFTNLFVVHAGQRFSVRLTDVEGHVVQAILT